MKYKIILLIIMIITVSGCESVYTLELDSGIFKETLEINNYYKTSWNNENPSYQYLIEKAENSSIASDYREEKPETNTKFAGVDYYNINKISTPDNLGLKYDSNFSKEKYKYSTIVYSNTEFLKYNYNKEKITINSGEDIKAFINYPKLERLTIKFTTNHNVLNNNADEIIDNNYYWYLNRNNYLNKKIDLEISNQFQEKQLKLLELDEEGYFGQTTLVAVYIITTIILIGVGITIYLKVRNSNR